MNKPLWSAALAVLTLAACGKKEEAPVPTTAPVASAPAAPVNAEEKVLNIYNWPDHIPEGMVAAFQAETGIKVNYEQYDSNESMLAKL